MTYAYYLVRSTTSSLGPHWRGLVSESTALSSPTLKPPRRSHTRNLPRSVPRQARRARKRVCQTQIYLSQVHHRRTSSILHLALPATQPSVARLDFALTSYFHVQLFNPAITFFVSPKPHSHHHAFQSLLYCLYFCFHVTSSRQLMISCSYS